MIKIKMDHCSNVDTVVFYPSLGAINWFCRRETVSIYVVRMLLYSLVSQLLAAITKIFLLFP